MGFDIGSAIGVAAKIAGKEGAGESGGSDGLGAVTNIFNGVTGSQAEENSPDDNQPEISTEDILKMEDSPQKLALLRQRLIKLENKEEESPGKGERALSGAVDGASKGIFGGFAGVAAGAALGGLKGLFKKDGQKESIKEEIELVQKEIERLEQLYPTGSSLNLNS